MKPSNKRIEEIKINKNQVFNLTFSSKQISKIDILVKVLPKSFRQSERGSGYCFLRNERDYSFSVRGYRRANDLITYFVSQIPRIKWECYENS